MQLDSIVREVRDIREAYARQFAYDLKAIHRDLKELERTCGRRVVRLSPRRPKQVAAKGEMSPK